MEPLLLEQLADDNDDANPADSIRAAVVIRTDQGLLLGGDSYKDWHIQGVLNGLQRSINNAERKHEHTKANRYRLAQKLVREQGRLSLIGGTASKLDYRKAEIDHVLHAKGDLFFKDFDDIMKVVRVTIQREVYEETRLKVDPDSIKFVDRMIGNNRTHIICSVFATGEIILDPDELLGLGMFTNVLPSIPKNRTFYQQHAIDFHNRLKTDRELVEKLRKMPLSHVRVRKSLVQTVYRHQCEGHAYAKGEKNFHLRQVPAMLRNTRHFEILEDETTTTPPTTLQELYLNSPPASATFPLEVNQYFISGLRKTVPPRAFLETQNEQKSLLFTPRIKTRK